MHLLANKIPRLALYGNVLNGFLVLTETKKTSGYLVLSDMHLLADKNPRLTLYGNVLYGFLVLSETKKTSGYLVLFDMHLLADKKPPTGFYGYNIGFFDLIPDQNLILLHFKTVFT